MLRRIRVKGFKSLVDVDVELSPLVVILGPNAAGKSNFLESLFLLSRLVSERTLADAFEPPLRGYPVEAFTLPDGGLPGLLAQRRAELSLEADIEPSSASGSQSAAIRLTPAANVRFIPGSMVRSLARRSHHGTGSQALAEKRARRAQRTLSGHAAPGAR